MPALHLHATHLSPRFLTDTTSGGISPTAIGLLIGVGLIPAIILIWVICWLLFGYPNDRNICCCVRKRKRTNKDQPDPAPPMVQRGSQDTLWDEAVVSLPKRPYVAWRSESGSSSLSNGGGGGGGEEGREMEKGGRPGWRERVSEGSAETVVGVQEPRRFV
ncbi:hypothetical protein NX059_002975 [Plenodomus lindquistii]|nr:hypothetical protein NX059_002975 [Plenodomus lindquistii]